MTGFRLRYLGPVVSIAICLFSLGTFTAISLFYQQVDLTKNLRENVESRRAAAELEECLTDLIALENDRVERVSVIHERVRLLIRALRETADQSEEHRLQVLIDQAFTDYLKLWQALPPPDSLDRDAARKKTTRFLETEVLTPCQTFKRFNAHRIEASAEHHERVLRQLAWGMAVVGGLGGVSGVILGYGVARGLARSISRLQVQLRDAAGKLGRDLPEIVVTGDGDFHGLHDEAERLTGRIEQVVSTLQQRNLEVLRAEQLAAVGQLAAGVGHEVRNPLTSIKMLVQAGLEDGGLNAEDLRVIEAEVRRTEKSLQAFLDFARPSVPNRRPTDLVPLVRGVVDLVHGRAGKQRVDVDLDLPREGAMVVADGEQLRQVLVNVCLNALDAMPSGGTLSVSVKPLPPHRVHIELSDTGPGIPRAIMSRLFQPFASTKDTGLGLGLVICRRIVEDHDGTIEAADRPEGGACITVTLPAAVAQPKATDAIPAGH